MKKVLMIASVASMIGQFNMPNLEVLKKIGYEVHVACNFERGNTCDKQSVDAIKEKLKTMGILCFQIDFVRNVFDFKQNEKAYRSVNSLLINNRYAFIHCHSPIGGVIGRIAATRTKTKVIYTAHGFHFYKGAPFKNWIFYYPVEYILAKYTDILITINGEDYKAAQKLGAKKVVYVPGVGIELAQFNLASRAELKSTIRKELGLKDEVVLILSVGELNKNKNHEVVIKALSKINEVDFHYIICGEGVLKNCLLQSINSLNLEKKVKLLGYRTDINKLYQAADMFIFPSLREGLSVALMEAMGSALPVICAKIRGNTDLVIEEKGGFLIQKVGDIDALSQHIKILMDNAGLRSTMGIFNQNRISEFSLHKVSKIMENIYKEI